MFFSLCLSGIWLTFGYFRRVYSLEVIQHPERTAEIGTSSLLSRLPLSPPLVVKLHVEDADGNEVPA